jgi:hypothetical protein
MPSQETTPLLSDHQALPLHNGTRQTQGSVPISVLVSRSAWPGLSSRALHFLRAGILAYLAALVPMLVRYKAAEKAAANVTPWSILFDFSMLSYILQLHWHLLSYVRRALEEPLLRLFVAHGGPCVSALEPAVPSRLSPRGSRRGCRSFFLDQGTPQLFAARPAAVFVQ